MAPKRPSASPAGGDTPKKARKTHTLERALTAANLSECMDFWAKKLRRRSRELRQVRKTVSKILKEIDPNIERSTAVIRGVMEKMTSYGVLLKEKQQEKAAIDNKLLQTAHTKLSNRIGDRR
ncbi:hypothetical protein E2C01_077016 [Portunus trituberculatus]|uniref:Uncharacterized protein n=1 Tax=Portunus trituberculatus TaxID=210409 RepID=A0A5B7IKL9_PORTR|nr:hypothetical protein [Portunus trituberculatus]